jgi:hypothetical protein
MAGRGFQKVGRVTCHMSRWSGVSSPPTYPLNPFSRQRRDQDESVASVDTSLY